MSEPVSKPMPMIGQDGARALFFIVFGLAGILLARDMPIGTAGEMGVGYVPRALSIGCLLIGGVLSIGAWRKRAQRVPLDLAWRPALLVTALVVAFGLLLPWLGLPLTIVALVLAAAASGEVFDWRMLAVTAVALATVSALLFHTLLRLQVPVWPKLMGIG